MKEDYSNYTDENLIKIMNEGLDLDEEMFFVLLEIGKRNHPKTKELCLEALNRDLGFDEYFVSSALSTLYFYDEDAALDYAKQNYKKFHVHSLGSIVSLLSMDSGEEIQTLKKREFIKIMKDHLKTLKKKDIEEIFDYDNFMKVYKNV
ncbi:hypothetical protein [Flavobacterium soli]|uniref:hypothetical protein n=1 Tax=Flavobacterium soli TaxID=344881 RepID=UPI0004151AEB|nr:hypothetical protein [Flavobacterium soli]